VSCGLTTVNSETPGRQVVVLLNSSYHSYQCVEHNERERERKVEKNEDRRPYAVQVKQFFMCVCVSMSFCVKEMS